MTTAETEAGIIVEKDLVPRYEKMKKKITVTRENIKRLLERNSTVAREMFWMTMLAWLRFLIGLNYLLMQRTNQGISHIRKRIWKIMKSYMIN